MTRAGHLIGVQPKKEGRIMADYFANFSLVVSLPSEAPEAYVLDLAEQALRIFLEVMRQCHRPGRLGVISRTVGRGP